MKNKYYRYIIATEDSKLEISRQQHYCLQLIVQGCRIPSEVAKKLEIGRSTATEMLQRMANIGLIKLVAFRLTINKTKYNKIIEMTELGYAVIEAVDEFIDLE
jgi:DNA-binding MarR family transcriptional regulator